ncbi:MAG TPA: hypothetical protein VNF24_04690 [Candidatus Acidoferrales bacterium]|nr:hypothetical protein [Candidatus Acidoferrales bacterium]
MTWGRYDDHFDDDERFMGLCLAARGLFVSCLPHCLRANSPRIVRALAEREAREETDQLAQALVDSGLWAQSEEGWVHANGGYAGWDHIVMPEAKRAEIEEKRRLAGKASAAARLKKHGTNIPSRARNSPQGGQTRPLVRPHEVGSMTEHSPSTTEPVPDPGPETVPEGKGPLGGGNTPLSGV